MRIFLWIILIFALPGWLSAQSLSNIRVKNIDTQSDTIVLDSVSLAPGTVAIEGVDSTRYLIDYPQALLIWQQKPTTDSVKISYRVWPVNISETVYHKDPGYIAPVSGITKNPFSYSGNSPQTESFSLGGLDKSGSISRGALFGNNQNLGVNSNLNLQLSGKLTDKIGIKAVISDKNIPVQPEGNTQQLQDFDQVYIQLFTKRTNLIAGDFQITKPNSYFMKYNKRLRGGMISTKFDLNRNDPSKGSNTVGVSGAISRGKFSRNVFAGTEGNQGPYRLTGDDGEGFIIILSGTETVYIDGKKLERGQQLDYIIDYNKAEISFTARQPITKDKRIVVEFQYSAQAYSRSLITVYDNLKTERLNLNFNLYSEQDNKNRPLLQDLTDENKALLQNIGDDVDQALVESVKTVEFSNDRVLYRQLFDTVTGDTIYQYSTNPDSAIYTISFTNVGPGNGNYIEIPSTANGRVFEYIAPLNGITQGRYEPVILLVTPRKKQMFTLGGDYKVTKNTVVGFEGALTVFDINTFSDIDHGDNLGYGFKVFTESQKSLSTKNNPWKLKGGVNYEQRADNFSEIERYRGVEFDRDWNIRDLPVTGNQYLPGATIGLEKKNTGMFVYDFKSFIAGNSYRGYRNSLVAKYKNRGFSADVTGSLLFTDGDLSNSNFNRHKALLKQDVKVLTLGFRDDFEHNIQRNPGSDSLLATSYSFWEWEAFVTNLDSTKNKFKVGYIYRYDNKSNGTELERATLGQSIVGELGLLKNPKSQLKIRSQYRTLQVQNDQLYSGKPENSFNTRLDYTFRLFKGAITASSFYEVGSGLEEERAFIYVEVPAGTGVYTWVDYNENGIAEQDEFEIAAFPDQANYIRVLTPTNNFVKVFRTQFNQSVYIMPQVVWSSKKGIRKMLSKFSDQVAYRVDRKTNVNDFEQWLNPFSTQVLDSNILSMTTSLRNTVYLNRTSPVWSVEYTYQNVNSKALQTNGLQGRTDAFHLANIRYNVSKIYQINIEGKTGTKQSGAAFFDTRNYSLTTNSAKPSITYLQGAGLKIIISYEWSEKKNAPEFGGEFINSQNISAELNINKVGKGSFILKGSYIVNKYIGEVNSAVAYEMLQGLDTGKNGLWELTYQRTIAKYLQLNLLYNGRVSEGNSAIHTGGVQVRAFF